MADWYVRPNTSHSAVRNGLSFDTAWGGWSAIVWGGAGVKPGDTLYAIGDFLESANASIGNHGATSDAARVTLHIPQGSSIRFSNKANFVYNTRPYTNIIGEGVIEAIINATTAQNCDIRGLGPGQPLKIRPLAGYSGISLGFSSEPGVHKNLLLQDLEIDGSNNLPVAPTSSVVAAIKGFITGGTATNFEAITMRRIKVTNFKATRGVISMFLASNANARAKDLVFDDIAFKNVAGLPLDIECAGPAGGLNVVATIDWSSGIKVNNIRVEDQFYGVNSDGVENNFGGAIFISGFANSTTPGFGPNRIDNIWAKNIRGDAGLVDILAGTYQGTNWYVDGLYTKNIDGCALLFDSGCHNCKIDSIVAKNITGRSGAISHAGAVVLVLDKVVNCEVSGIDADEVWEVVGAYATGTACKVTVSNVTATNVRGYGANISSNVTLINGVRVVNATISGSGVSVNNENALIWENEDNNYWNMSGAAVNHTFGANSKVGVDPMLDADTRRPRPGSPLLGSAIFAGYMRDATGRRCKPKGSIGAYEDFTVTSRAIRT